MSEEGKSAFAARLKQKAEQKKTMECFDAPNTSAYVPAGQKYVAVSIWGPKGPYAKSDKYTFEVLGTFATVEEADTHIFNLKTRPDCKALTLVQNVVLTTGAPIPMPLLPKPGVTRHFQGDDKEHAEEWSKFLKNREEEEMEVNMRMLKATEQWRKDKKQNGSNSTVVEKGMKEG